MILFSEWLIFKIGLFKCKILFSIPKLIYVQCKTFAVGAELVQAGFSAYGNVEVEQIEDSLITGTKKDL